MWHPMISQTLFIVTSNPVESGTNQNGLDKLKLRHDIPIESDNAVTFANEFETHHSQARQALQFAQVTQQRNYNKGRLDLEFEVGDQVLLNPHSLNLLHAEKGVSANTYRLWMLASCDTSCP